MADSSRKRWRGKKRKLDGERHGVAACTVGGSSDLVVDFDKFASTYPDFSEAWSSLKARRAARAASHVPAAAAPAPSASASFSTHVDSAFNLALTRAILRSNFGLRLPSMPAGRLCPPVPNRLNYVVWLKDLLRQSSDPAYFDSEARGYRYRAIDIGCGASCIYPLLLTTGKFSEDDRWKVLATEVDEESARSAKANVEANDLNDRIDVELVRGTSRQLGEVSEEGDAGCANEVLGPVRIAVEKAEAQSTRPGTTNPAVFDFCMTNPPFYNALSQATEPRRGDGRSRTDMTESEGVYPGGELGFVRDMIRDSLHLADRVTWYTSMVGKKSTLVDLEKELRLLLSKGAIRTTTFVQGRTMRWGIGWTLKRTNARSPATKVEGGLQSFEVILDNPEVDAVGEVVNRIRSYCRWITTSKALRLEFSTVVSGHSTICTIVESNSPRTAHEGDVRLPAEGHFLIDANIRELDTTKEANGGPDKLKDGGRRRVDVRLECFSHSAVGSAAIEQIRSQISGEVGRVNRRWRRLLAKQEIERSTR